MGKYDPIWYSLPYAGATTFQEMYGPIPVLPLTGDEMEVNPVLPKLWRKKKRIGTYQIQHKPDKKYLCKFCYSKDYYTAKCINSHVSSVITEYEKEASNYLHGLQVVEFLNEVSLW